jgi:hypothetical protein
MKRKGLPVAAPYRLGADFANRFQKYRVKSPAIRLSRHNEGR